jgi:hypothetical protein
MAVLERECKNRDHVKDAQRRQMEMWGKDCLVVSFHEAVGGRSCLAERERQSLAGLADVMTQVRAIPVSFCGTVRDF